MSFSITYRRLFAVDLLHGFYLNQGEGRSFEAHLAEKRQELLKNYDISRDLLIVPTPETLAELRSRKMAFRTSSQGFYVGIQLDPVAASSGQEKPAVTFDETFRLTFAVSLRNPYFYNYTGLRLNDNRHRPYFFTNRANNQRNTELHISKPVAAFDDQEAYQAGDLYVDDEAAPTSVFEATRANGPGTLNPDDWQVVQIVPEPVPTAPYQTGDAIIVDNVLYVAKETTAATPPSADWEANPLSHQYVTHRDRVPMYPEVFSFDITPASANKATLKLFRPGEAEAAFSHTVEGSPTLTMFPVDMRLAASGLYEFRLETEAGTQIVTPYDGLFYLDQSLYQAQVFAIVEISVDPVEDLGGYDLLDAGGELRSPVYTVRFRNRTTFWRYIFGKSQSVSDADLGALERDGDASETHRFRTRQPQPLLQAFQAVKKFDTDTLLPNPTVNLVKPNQTDQKIYSEIFIQN